MRRALLLCIFIAASRLSAGECVANWLGPFPYAPTQHDAFELRFAGWCSDNCTPGEPRVEVRDGTIRIDFDVDACPLPVLTQWGERVFVGALPGGSYAVDVRINGTRVLEETVHVAGVPFRVLPMAAASGQTVAIDRLELGNCPDTGICEEVSVRFDGIASPEVQVVNETTILARVPELNFGYADIVVRNRNGQTFASPDAVRISTALVETELERVLVPLAFEGPGAHGSYWTAATRIHNEEGPLNIPIHPSLPLLTAPDASPYAFIPPGTTAVVLGRPRDGGVLLHVARGLEERLVYQSHFADTSRRDLDLGTEVRVVREREMASTIRIASVPFHPRYRAMLRIYGIEGDADEVEVTLQGNGVTRSVPVQLQEGEGCRQGGCLPERPAFAALDLSTIPGLAGQELVDVIVQSRRNDHHLWAFVSVTNNETQHVTLYSPQHEVR